MPVLVVGAGPVGLLTAFVLSQRGMACTVLEQHAVALNRSRASTFQPAVLDRLSGLGLAAPLLAAGLKVDRIRSWDLNTGHQNDLDYAVIAADTAHPFRLHLEQAALRTLLLQRLAAPGGAPVELLEQHRVEALERNEAGEGVRLRIRPAAGGDRLLHRSGRWLVVADGARSGLRSQLGLPFDGVDMPEPVVRLMLPALPEAIARQLAGVTYGRAGVRSFSALRMPEGWRLILRPSAQESQAALTDPTWARGVLVELFASLVDPAWWSTAPLQWDHYGVAQRCVPQRRVGAALVLGDAAHVTNTRGGLNMNFGLLEAMALAEALALGGSAPEMIEPALDAWARLWQSHTIHALLPRTSRLLAGGTPLDGTVAAAGSGQASSAAAPDPQESRLRLIKASLLDLNAPP
ncbi:NAD(P)/FAD-dependent oxidoreductase [Synechococcus sp. CS-1328]|uniref:FAD-dependent oxidoreductase n=1 Tax=Synechococcus sp. CS-1328 TaxID=2847976 RepID=UPI00223A84D7|nr:FAD-dependent monooxygenase [Synechococcus sp. CS-1328]MCT0224794.1 FAD-dependent monooxygenase [Synechococcus sp. CS-1328]